MCSVQNCLHTASATLASIASASSTPASSSVTLQLSGSAARLSLAVLVAQPSLLLSAVIPPTTRLFNHTAMVPCNRVCTDSLTATHHRHVLPPQHSHSFTHSLTHYPHTSHHHQSPLSHSLTHSLIASPPDKTCTISTLSSCHCQAVCGAARGRWLRETE